MNLDRFRQIVDTYGADPARWPATERADAAAFLAANAAARRALRGAQRLDAALAAWTVEPAAPDAQVLTARVTARPQLRALRGGALPHGGLSWPDVAGLAAAAVAGFIVGWSGLDAGLATAAWDGADPYSTAAIIEEATW